VLKRGNIPWNKGLTKETDMRVMKIANSKKGHLVSEETRKKISEAKKGRTLSEEQKNRISDTLKGHSVSKETRKKISDAMMGNKNQEKNRSKETRMKISTALLGNTSGFPQGHMPWNKELTKGENASVRKISEALKGKKLSEEHRQKLSEAHKGNRHSEETKEKLRKHRLKQVIPVKNTSIEIAIQNELNKRKINYQTHLPVCGVCVPDMVFPELQVAVFADGDYWHSREFDNGRTWKRDRKQNGVLRKNGWVPIRFWGSEIREDVSGCVDQIVSILEGI